MQPPVDLFGPRAHASTCALILSAGGVAAISWQLGVLHALSTSGIDLRRFDPVVGTSAGATVGAQLVTEQLDTAVAMQLAPNSTEIATDFDMDEYKAGLADVVRGAATAAEARARIGGMALRSNTMAPAERSAVVLARLPVRRWPADRALYITAVDAHAGTLAIFDRATGVPLPVAVTASSAVPGVWPTVEALGRQFIDGGIRSQTNADVGQTKTAVVLVGTRLDEADRRRLNRETTQFRSWLAIEADDQSLAAIGPNPLDPRRRADALRAGIRQGVRAAPEVALTLAYAPAADT